MTVRLVLRSLRGAPWYALAIVALLALGLSFATTVLGVVDGVLFKPLPFPDSDSLYAVRPGFSVFLPDKNPFPASPSDLSSWTEELVGVGITGFNAGRVTGFGESVNESPAGVARIGPNFFTVIGVPPLIGGFAPDDFERATLLRPVVLTYEACRSRFGGVESALGQVVVTDQSSGSGYRVVGVMPPDFVFPSRIASVSLITPYVLTRDEINNPQLRVYSEIIARLPRGSLDRTALRSRIELSMGRVAGAAKPRGVKPDGMSERDWVVSGPFDRVDIQPLTVALGAENRTWFGAAFVWAMVLLVASAFSCSGLVVARSRERFAHFVMHAVLGATAASISRLVVIEVAILVGTATIIGLTAAWPLLRFSLALLPDELVLLKTARLDWRIAALTASMGFGLLLLISLWPVRRVLSATHQGLSSAGVRYTEPTTAIGRTAIWISQVAGSFCLTIIGLLLVSSVVLAYSEPLPSHTTEILVIRAQVLGQGREMRIGSAQRRLRVDNVRTRLEALPGVVAVGVTSGQVAGMGVVQSPFVRPDEAAQQLDVGVQAVTSGYFRVVSLEVLTGRVPLDSELAANDRVLVVSDSVAKAYWPHSTAIGRTLFARDDPSPFTVVGVVKDIRWGPLDRKSGTIYGPFGFLERSPLPNFLIRTYQNTDIILLAALEAFRQADPNLVPRRAGVLSDLARDSVRDRRFRAWLFGVASLCSLSQVFIALSALSAMAATRRMKEIAVRRVLGAGKLTIIGLLLRDKLKPIGVGLVVGGVAAAWTVRFVDSFLYRIESNDVSIWLAAALLVVSTALGGALVPAIRASGFDSASLLKEA